MSGAFKSEIIGGHIIFAMFGDKLRYIARGFFFSLIAFGLFGGFDQNLGWPGWRVWAVVLYFIVKIEHHRKGILKERVGILKQILNDCTLCPSFSLI